MYGAVARSYTQGYISLYFLMFIKIRTKFTYKSLSVCNKQKKLTLKNIIDIICSYMKKYCYIRNLDNNDKDAVDCIDDSRPSSRYNIDLWDLEDILIEWKCYK